MAKIRVGLASQSHTVQLDDLRRVAAALDTQVRRDLRPVWGIEATVELVADPLRIPTGLWPIIVMDHTPLNVGGLHTTDHGIPFAVALSSRDWGLAASHECIEMLIDPTGNATRRAIGLQVVDGEVRDLDEHFDYLLEACDPIEDIDHAYDIGGVTVADFYTPHYFDDRLTPGTRYSFNGALTRPREVRPNGLPQLAPPQAGPAAAVARVRHPADHHLARSRQGGHAKRQLAAGIRGQAHGHAPLQTAPAAGPGCASQTGLTRRRLIHAAPWMPCRCRPSPRTRPPVPLCCACGGSICATTVGACCWCCC